MTFYKPKEPTQAIITANFGEYKSVTIIGHIPKETETFAVNLINGNTGNIHLQITVRFKEKIMARNTCKNGSWGQEEKDTPILPFKPGDNVMMEITNGEEAIEVYCNGNKVFSYEHRLPFKEIDVITLNENCMFKCIQF
ncbi:galectin-4-like [Dendropsophus ebraccatus]|uniref:galectin-4-like n=1 Tax=Dendropsophus ebraccatus TaxID=150705 RepID=UPI00383137B5